MSVLRSGCCSFTSSRTAAAGARAPVDLAHAVAGSPVADVGELHALALRTRDLVADVRFASRADRAVRAASRPSDRRAAAHARRGGSPRSEAEPVFAPEEQRAERECRRSARTAAAARASRDAPAVRRTAMGSAVWARSTRGSCRNTSTRSAPDVRCELDACDDLLAFERAFTVEGERRLEIRRASRRGGADDAASANGAASAISSTRPRASPASRAIPARPAYAASRGETIRVIRRLRATSSAGGVGTVSSASATTSSPRTRCTQSSGRSMSRWARAGIAIAFTSSGTTKSRPETAAWRAGELQHREAAARARADGQAPRRTRCRDQIDDIAARSIPRRAPAPARVASRAASPCRRSARARARPRRAPSRRRAFRSRRSRLG